MTTIEDELKALEGKLTYRYWDSSRNVAEDWKKVFDKLTPQAFYDMLKKGVPAGLRTEVSLDLEPYISKRL